MNKLKALIVDDKEENLYFLESVLGPENYEVYRAANGIEALASARQNLPDIVISDVLMPQMDGYTLCREMKRDPVLKQTPFIFYTATYNHPKDAEYGLELGACRFILKPQGPDEFMLIVNEVLENLKTGSLVSPPVPEVPEEVILKEYNEALIRKLEDKMLQTEKAEKELSMYAAKLEEEIRQRIRTEERLRQSESKYRSIFDSVRDVYYRVALDGRVIEMSPSVELFIGYTPDELIGSEVMDLYYNPKDRTDFLERIKEEKEITDYIIRIRAKCGEIKYASINAKLVCDSGCKPFCIEGAIRDISKRIQAEKRTRIFGQALEQSPSTIVITNEKGAIEYVNPKFTEVTGYQPEEVMGQNPKMLKSGTHNNDFYSSLWSTILAGKSWRGELHNRKKSGELFWERAIISPIANEDYMITHYIAIKEDITKEKELHCELVRAKMRAEESDRLKTAFLQNLSHELRTPMNGILGFTQLLLQNDGDEDLKTEYLELIERSGFRLLNIINDLVEISKIETGQISLVNEDFNINDTFRELLSVFQTQVTEKEIEIQISGYLPVHRCVIHGDRGRVYQVLANLLSNAIKFTRKGHINFGCVEKEGFLQFYVEDTGIGISHEFSEVIFERFMQVDSTTSRGYEGAGLGLSISKGFVEKMGGRIWVESKLQEGSTFFFTLPAALKNSFHEAPGVEELSAKDSAKAATIMIVEDDYVNYVYLSEVLQRAGFTVVGARDGREALELFEQFPQVSLVLMDLKMPGMSGYDALKKIREMGFRMPVVAQTAYADQAEKQRALSDGFDGFLTKPLGRSEIVKQVKEFVNGT